MNREDNLFDKAKSAVKTVTLTKKILMIIPFVFILFIMLYGALHIEIDMEAVDCLIVDNCDGSQGGSGNTTSLQNPETKSVLAVKERKKDSQESAIPVASGFGHQSEVYQPISDVEIENLASQIVSAREWLGEQTLEEPAEMYGQVPKTTISIGGLDTTDMDHWEMALAAAELTGWHPLFIISQWQLETGHFKSNNYRVNNNIAGQTWTPSSKYPKGTARPKAEGGWYIRYPNAVEGYVDFVLNNPRYSKVKTLKTPEQQAQEVAKQGWAVDPLYASKLTGMIAKNRAKYGEGNVSAPKTDAGATIPGEIEPNSDGDKIAEEAYRLYEARGINSSNPMHYSIEKSGEEDFADSSEFTQMVYQKALGKNIGATNIEQITKNAEFFNTDKKQLKPGDLVYFNSPGGHGHTRTVNGRSVTVDHTGIYVGDNKFIDMSSGKDGIAVKDIGSGGQYESYFNKSFIGFIRIGTQGSGNAITEDGSNQGGLYTQNGMTVDEAELHIRALMNSDWYAIDEELMFELNKKGKLVKTNYPGVNGKVNKLKKEYEGTNVEDTYLLAMALKTDDKGDRERVVNYVSENRHKNWNDSDWMLNVRFLVYNCYFIGDDPPQDGLLDRLKEWISGIFEDGPCETLDKYWKRVKEDKKAVYIPIEERAALTHINTRYEYTYICKPPPPPPPPTPEEEDSRSNDSGNSRDSDGGRYGGPQPLAIKATQRGTASYANHKDIHVGKNQHNCQYGVEKEIVEEKEYAQYPSLYSGAKDKSILKNFEKYTLILDGVNTMKGETYPTEIERVLRLFYGDMLDQNEHQMISMIGGGTDFIVPMEDGTYNYSSAFRSSHRPTHNGVDMGTLGVTGVPIYSTSNGTVVSTGWVNGYGYTVMVQHTNGYYSFYAHMLEDYIVVNKGQVVSQAQLIGGVDGVPDLAEHLHFEVCERAVTSASGNLMCADHVDPEDDDDSADGRPDDVKLSLNPNQDMTKSRSASTKFLSEWKEKAKSGSLFIMPGFSAVTGNLSKEFENKDGGCVNYSSDAGGMSCGYHQFANNVGSVCAFVNWLGTSGHSDYYNVFSSYCPSGVTKVSQYNAFMSTWHGLKTDGDYPMDFKNAQLIYARSVYYEPAAKMLKDKFNLDVNTRHVAVQEMVWSIGIQQKYLMEGMFKKAGFSSNTDWSKVTDREIIEKVYQARYDSVPQNFVSSPTLWDSLRNRYVKEKEAALAILVGN